jgi:hypothetical protein
VPKQHPKATDELYAVRIEKNKKKTNIRLTFQTITVGDTFHADPHPFNIDYISKMVELLFFFVLLIPKFLFLFYLYTISHGLLCVLSVCACFFFFFSCLFCMSVVDYCIVIKVFVYLWEI